MSKHNFHFTFLSTFLSPVLFSSFTFFFKVFISGFFSLFFSPPLLTLSSLFTLFYFPPLTFFLLFPLPLSSLLPPPHHPLSTLCSSPLTFVPHFLFSLIRSKKELICFSPFLSFFSYSPLSEPFVCCFVC